MLPSRRHCVFFYYTRRIPRYNRKTAALRNFRAMMAGVMFMDRIGTSFLGSMGRALKLIQKNNQHLFHQTSHVEYVAMVWKDERIY